MTKTFKEHGFSVKEQVSAIIALLLIVAVIGWFLPIGPASSGSPLSTGTQLVEDYDPLVMQAGLNTNKAVAFGSTLSVTGASTLTGLTTIGSGGIKVGSNGSTVTQVIKGTGSIIGNRSLTASTTGAFDIAVTGAVSGDNCFAQAASTTQVSLGFSIIGCSASTTSGYITLLVNNATGGNAVVPYPIASSTNYLIVR